MSVYQRVHITESPDGCTVAVSRSDVDKSGVSRVLPPVHRGRRGTDRLSSRGGRALYDACKFAIEDGAPLRAFWTLTIAAEFREPYLCGDKTIGGSVREFLMRLGKLWGRRFRYVWVAECPGLTNLHVHMLVDVVIDRDEFKEVAAEIERVWGMGFVHIEWIKDPEAAPEYLLKACGYVSKGCASGDQGWVWGRRWGVSYGLRRSKTYEAEVSDDGYSRFWKLARVRKTLGSSDGVYLRYRGYKADDVILDLQLAGVL